VSVCICVLETQEIAMSKYAPLTRHLNARHQTEVPMQFSELEGLLGFSLPPSSRKHRAWWSNNEDSSVITKAWLAAGYRTRDVDLASERLVFVKLNSVSTDVGSEAGAVPSGTATAASVADTVPGETKPPRRHPLFGIFAGQMWIDPTLDLTEPAMPEWAGMIDAKYGPDPDDKR
jgi:hypothetical protein